MKQLAEQLRKFAAEREWGVYHSPKNLAMALNVEAGELLEHFQWLSEEESRCLTEEKRDAVAGEIADVLIYIVRLADELGIDPVAAAGRKIAVNAEKYPVDLARGNAVKYTELGEKKE